MSRPKQKIIPFFLPMQGCPARCVYCDQRSISGRALPPADAEIAAALAAFSADRRAELAYYGGSFTCLPRETQLHYLELAAPALAAGKIGGLRISTRPDAVDAESCAFLRAHGVVTVELGVQSFDDGVLAAGNRGYTAERAREGCRAVRDSGLRLGVQLMTGLPGDTPSLARASLAQALELGARLLRVYPTLVLRDTPLAALYAQGRFQPQTLEQAVELCADLLRHSLASGSVMQRMGLNPGPELEAALLAGPYHPAFGALVREELWSRMLQALLDAAACDPAASAVLRCHPADAALLHGQKDMRWQALRRRWPALALTPDPSLARGSLLLNAPTGRFATDEQRFCAAE